MNPELIIILPFIALLLSISVLPLVRGEWWEKKYPYISFGLAAIVLVYYFFVKPNPGKVLLTIEEYVSFISLLFSLFLVSGGIFFRLKGKATPLRNVMLLLTGAVIANIFGTTGASMLLIRPFIESNKYRLKPYHIIFFIFVIGNTGGLLTPIGDPPLLLGYIKGVPFFWTLVNLLPVWLMTIGYLLVLFFFIDRHFYEKVPQNIQDDIEEQPEKLELKGVLNIIPLFIIAGSVFITKPFLLREVIMITTALVSYKITKKDIHLRNHFNFAPIREVAILFLGIFITMMPALEYISVNSRSLGLDSITRIYWTAGFLTSFLDNAPTYLNFLTGAMGVFGLSVDNPADVLRFVESEAVFLRAVSVASVIFGAMTYIGNAPNFMIKSIAEHKGLQMPGFFQYIVKYSIVILLPFYFILWLLFFRQ
ncbi:MAG: sodium:proton antiporter [Ignavibacteriae bacterium]|nr:sodium:proton antiporter [Ignavibacteriota bacterium]